jgi:hypothetical protein
VVVVPLVVYCFFGLKPEPNTQTRLGEPPTPLPFLTDH